MIILFFGSARYNKGPDILLESLSYIEQENITIVFAGKSDSITQKDVQKARQKTDHKIKIITRFEFIPDDQIDTYFTRLTLWRYRTEANMMEQVAFYKDQSLLNALLLERIVESLGVQ